MFESYVQCGDSSFIRGHEAGESVDFRVLLQGADVYRILMRISMEVTMVIRKFRMQNESEAMQCVFPCVCAGVCLGVYPLHAAVHPHPVVSAWPQPAHVCGLQALPAALHAQHRSVCPEERRAVGWRRHRRGHHHRRSCTGW